MKLEKHPDPQLKTMLKTDVTAPFCSVNGAEEQKRRKRQRRWSSTAVQTMSRAYWTLRPSGTLTTITD